MEYTHIVKANWIKLSHEYFNLITSAMYYTYLISMAILFPEIKPQIIHRPEACLAKM